MLSMKTSHKQIQIIVIILINMPLIYLTVLINENDIDIKLSHSPYKFNEKMVGTSEKQLLIYGDICK